MTPGDLREGLREAAPGLSRPGEAFDFVLLCTLKWQSLKSSQGEVTLNFSRGTLT